MTKLSPEYLNLADNLLKQFAQEQSDSLSTILNKDDIERFQAQYTGSRVRRFPPVKTLALFMHQVASSRPKTAFAFQSRSVVPELDSHWAG